ncbi:MAG: hypothetical protein RRY07_04200 [Bacteroidaceae bacterium]
MENANSTHSSFAEKIAGTARCILLLMKRDLVENRWTFLTPLLAIYGMLLLRALYATYQISENYIRYSTMGVEECSFPIHMMEKAIFPLMWIALCGMAVFSAVSTFAVKGKGENITLMTLPATMGEKFTAGILLRSVGMMLTLYLVFNLADLTRLLYQPAHTECVSHLMVHEQCSLAISRMLEWAGGSTFDCQRFIATILAFALLHSVCILSSALWTKRAKIKSTILIIVTTTLGSYLLYLALSWIQQSGYDDLDFTRLHSISEMTMYFQILNTVLGLMLLGIYFLTYRLYKHRTLKERKLLGVL